MFTRWLSLHWCKCEHIVRLAQEMMRTRKPSGECVRRLDGNDGL